MSEQIVPNTHKSKLRDPHYENVNSGKKIYEMRVYDEKRQAMKEGDTWIFSYDGEEERNPIETIINDIVIFETFREAIEDTGIENLLPDVDYIEEGIYIYESFPHKEGTYKEGAKKFGVVRFKLELV